MTEACPKPCSGATPWDIPLLGSATRPNWLSVCQSRVCQEFGVTDCVGSTFGLRTGVRRR
jgi:hypothetical protein